MAKCVVSQVVNRVVKISNSWDSVFKLPVYGRKVELIFAQNKTALQVTCDT